MRRYRRTAVGQKATGALGDIALHRARAGNRLSTVTRARDIFCNYHLVFTLLCFVLSGQRGVYLYAYVLFVFCSWFVNVIYTQLRKTLFGHCKECGISVSTTGARSRRHTHCNRCPLVSAFFYFPAVEKVSINHAIQTYGTRASTRFSSRRLCSGTRILQSSPCRLPAPSQFFGNKQMV